MLVHCTLNIAKTEMKNIFFLDVASIGVRPRFSSAKPGDKWDDRKANLNIAMKPRYFKKS
jgi:hypothetical protein